MTGAGESNLAPVSDGSMPCPVPSPSGLPCIKKIPVGWTADEGHGGGHWWESPESTAAVEAGAHYDAVRLLSGLPTAMHMPADCTPECPRWTEAER